MLKFFLKIIINKSLRKGLCWFGPLPRERDMRDGPGWGPTGLWGEPRVSGPLRTIGSRYFIEFFLSVPFGFTSGDADLSTNA
jgi:hypothetical protein